MYKRYKRVRCRETQPEDSTRKAYSSSSKSILELKKKVINIVGNVRMNKRFKSDYTRNQC